MEIITQRYRRETGKSAYKHNWFGKRIHNQDYVDWLEKQCTIHGVINCTEIMRQRFLNPKRLNIELEALQITIIDGVSYRTFTKQYTSVDNGSCQCYKDCDCSSRLGTTTKTEITWYRNIKFDGTDKCFYSEPYTQKEYCL